MMLSDGAFTVAYAQLADAQVKRVAAENDLVGMKFANELAKAAVIVNGIEGKNADERKARLDLQFVQADTAIMHAEQALKSLRMAEEIARQETDKLKQLLRLAELSNEFDVAEQLKILHNKLDEALQQEQIDETDTD